MKKFKATGIEYECDGYEPQLPTTLVVECESEDEVADKISDETGWLVNSIDSITLIP